MLDFSHAHIMKKVVGLVLLAGMVLYACERKQEEAQSATAEKERQNNLSQVKADSIMEKGIGKKSALPLRIHKNGLERFMKQKSGEQAKLDTAVTIDDKNLLITIFTYHVAGDEEEDDQGYALLTLWHIKGDSLERVSFEEGVDLEWPMAFFFRQYANFPDESVLLVFERLTGYGGDLDMEAGNYFYQYQQNKPVKCILKREIAYMPGQGDLSYELIKSDENELSVRFIEDHFSTVFDENGHPNERTLVKSDTSTADLHYRELLDTQQRP